MKNGKLSHLLKKTENNENYRIVQFENGKNNEKKSIKKKKSFFCVKIRQNGKD